VYVRKVLVTNVYVYNEIWFTRYYTELWSQVYVRKAPLLDRPGAFNIIWVRNVATHCSSVGRVSPELIFRLNFCSTGTKSLSTCNHCKPLKYERSYPVSTNVLPKTVCLTPCKLKIFTIYRFNPYLTENNISIKTQLVCAVLEFMAICYMNLMENISAWCGQNAGFLILDVFVRLHTNNWSLKGLKTFFVSLHTRFYVSECGCVYSCVWPMYPLKHSSSLEFF